MVHYRKNIRNARSEEYMSRKGVSERWFTQCFNFFFPTLYVREIVLLRDPSVEDDTTICYGVIVTLRKEGKDEILRLLENGLKQLIRTQETKQEYVLSIYTNRESQHYVSAFISALDRVCNLLSLVGSATKSENVHNRMMHSLFPENPQLHANKKIDLPALKSTLTN